MGLIPCIQIPELPLSFLLHVPILQNFLDPKHPPSIKPFGTLVAIGVYVGSIVAARHAKERGLDEKKMSDVIFWVVGIGFIGGHVLDAIFYHWPTVQADPLYIFKLWDGLSSYGGFTGAVIGALLWRWHRKENILPYAECVNSAFPLAWVFGRMGCASVHDHPGAISNQWFALTKWPDPHVPGGFGPGRIDLGLVEMVLTIPLAIAFLIAWNRKPVRPLGFYGGWMCVAYAPVRFFLDFLRESDENGGDVRYGPLTPAQWACFGLLALGLYLLHRSRQPDALVGAVGTGTPETEDLDDEDEGPAEGEAPRARRAQHDSEGEEKSR